MSNLFGHETLRVYQVSVEFVTLGDSLLACVERKTAACDHLLRAMEGIPLHIAQANNTWSAKERVTYLGHANGSVLECAACLDVLVAKRRLGGEQAEPGKRLLCQICGMLNAMQKCASKRVREEEALYETRQGVFFSHERLDVYQAALGFVTWCDEFCRGLTGRRELVDRLDKASTSIVLNIAEGNGRFTSVDHTRFLAMAHSATVQSAAMLDLTVARKMVAVGSTREGRKLLERIGAMLTAMARKVAHS